MKYLLPILLLFAVQVSFAQNITNSITITGQVIDEKGAPAISATVQISVDSTVIAETVTDYDGNYQIKIGYRKEVGTIIHKYIGSKTHFIRGIQLDRDTIVNTIQLEVDSNYQADMVCIYDAPLIFIDRERRSSESFDTHISTDEIIEFQMDKMISNHKNRFLYLDTDCKVILAH
ncbi:MAG: hypothetical protein R2800_02430 [Flavipsychrobacter sp.]